MIDFLIIAVVTVCGAFGAPWGVMALGAGALAASPIWRMHAKARRHPHIDSRRILRKLSLDAVLRATAAVIAAYLIGLIIGRFTLP
jgi:hypothetical protein